LERPHTLAAVLWRLRESLRLEPEQPLAVNDLGAALTGSLENG